MMKIQSTASDLANAYRRLRDMLDGYGSLVVAYSGGVDSGLLVFAARQVLGERMVAVIGNSASLARREREVALGFLATHDIPHEEIDTDELSDARYRRNHADRCFFCKAELFAGLHRVATRRGFDCVAYGANLDDRSDHRPGGVAAERQGIVAPLAEAGLGKAVIRELARMLGLSLWDKPASPCLASRIPYFSEVTREKLAQIESAEGVLKDLGFDVCRVRHHGGEARIEIPAEQHERIRVVWDRVEAGFRAADFHEVTLEASGFRSGRLNDALTDTERLGGSE